MLIRVYIAESSAVLLDIVNALILRRSKRLKRLRIKKITIFTPLGLCCVHFPDNVLRRFKFLVIRHNRGPCVSAIHSVFIIGLRINAVFVKHKRNRAVGSVPKLGSRNRNRRCGQSSQLQ